MIADAVGIGNRLGMHAVLAVCDTIEGACDVLAFGCGLNMRVHISDTYTPCVASNWSVMRFDDSTLTFWHF